MIRAALAGLLLAFPACTITEEFQDGELTRRSLTLGPVLWRAPEAAPARTTQKGVGVLVAPLGALVGYFEVEWWLPGDCQVELRVQDAGEVASILDMIESIGNVCANPGG